MPKKATKLQFLAFCLLLAGSAGTIAAAERDLSPVQAYSLFYNE